jgi:hypothetical protein
MEVAAVLPARLQAMVLQPVVRVAMAKQVLRPARVQCPVAVLLVPVVVVRLPAAEVEAERPLPLPEVHSTEGRQTDLLSFCAKKVP